MFRMFPVNTSANLNNVNVRKNATRSIARNDAIYTNSLQITSKVSSIFQIYNTKTYSCGSCGR